jgi:hypothetical protein
MAYRPQFVTSTPDGYVDQPFIYYFDSSNVPAFAAGSIASGQALRDVPLQLDQDAAFILEAVEIDDPDGLLSIQLQDPSGNYLSDSAVPTSLAYEGVAPSAAGTPGMLAPLQSRVICAPGSAFRVTVQNSN